jgi:hypothetical protein
MYHHFPIRPLQYVTALYLTWLCTFDAYHLYQAFQRRVMMCDTAFDIDNEVFHAACEDFRQMGSPLYRTVMCVLEECTDKSHWVIYAILFIMAWHTARFIYDRYRLIAYGNYVAADNRRVERGRRMNTSI